MITRIIATLITLGLIGLCGLFVVTADPPGEHDLVLAWLFGLVTLAGSYLVYTIWASP